MDEFDRQLATISDEWAKKLSVLHKCVRCKKIKGAKKFDIEPGSIEKRERWCRSCKLKYLKSYGKQRVRNYKDQQWLKRSWAMV